MMIEILFIEAARNVAKEPVSIEPDLTVWADSDGRIIDPVLIQEEYERLISEQQSAMAAKQAAVDSARAKLTALGLTEEEVLALLGNAGV